MHSSCNRGLCHASELTNNCIRCCCCGTGDIYFTDPSYGLNEREHDAARELAFNGIYRIPAAAQVNGLSANSRKKQISGESQELNFNERKLGGLKIELLDGTMTRPNGIAFSPKQDKWVYTLLLHFDYVQYNY
jgi:sugar lactone lactonase YvrE